MTSKFAPRGPLPEGQLSRLLSTGASIRDLARELDRSPSTIRYWLDRYGLAVRPRISRKERAIATRAAGGSRFEADCRRHGRTDFLAMANGRSRCSRCNAEAVMRRRRGVKEQLVAEAGGSCVVCGYARSLVALQFHHLARESKDFAIAERGVTRSIESARAEACKCVLICANCHAEVEAGLRELP